MHLNANMDIHSGLDLSTNLKQYNISPYGIIQKRPSRGVLREKCFENMLQIHKETLMPKCDFNKAALQLY